MKEESSTKLDKLTSYAAINVSKTSLDHRSSSRSVESMIVDRKLLSQVARQQTFITMNDENSCTTEGDDDGHLITSRGTAKDFDVTIATRDRV